MGAACPAPDTEERPTKDFRTDTAERRATTEPPPSESDPFLGAIVGGRYQVLGRAGEGAYGAVYQVQHLDIGRVFALKVLRARHLFDGTQVARFRREAQTAAAIAHPGIVDVTDFGLTDADQPYIVMEWLEGSTLGHTVRAQGPMPPDEVRRIVVDVAEALAAAHAAGVVHRDLKPDNILLPADGGSPKVTDFGLCACKENAGPRVTQAGQIFGTPFYMAPEQASGSETTAACDVYALGCILFELMTGRPVFDQGSSVQVMLSHINDPAPMVSQTTRRPVPPELDALVERCLSKEPADRPTMEELVEELRPASVPRSAATALLPEPGPAPGPTWVPGQERLWHRAELLVGLGAAIVASLVAAAVWLARAPNASSSPPVAAQVVHATAPTAPEGTRAPVEAALPAALPAAAGDDGPGSQAEPAAPEVRKAKRKGKKKRKASRRRSPRRVRAEGKEASPKPQPAGEEPLPKDLLPF